MYGAARDFTAACPMPLPCNVPAAIPNTGDVTPTSSSWSVSSSITPGPTLRCVQRMRRWIAPAVISPAGNIAMSPQPVWPVIVRWNRIRGG